MVNSRLTPLEHNVPITDENGFPTPYFIQKLQTLFLEKEITDSAVAEAAPQSLILTAGVGLSGGGNLTTDRTFDIGAGAGLVGNSDDIAVGAGTGITVNANDVAIDLTAEAERIRDVIAAALVAGTNITITPNDGGDTITISSSGGGGGGGGTAWANGMMNRRPLGLTATATGSFIGDPNLSLAATPSNIFYWNTSAGAQKIVFDFVTANIVDGFMIFQNNATAQGTWDFEGSNDNVSWTPIDVGFAWTPAAIGGSQVVKRTPVNATAYRYYRFIKTAGSTNSSPYVNWFIFRCEDIG